MHAVSLHTMSVFWGGLTSACPHVLVSETIQWIAMKFCIEGVLIRSCQGNLILGLLINQPLVYMKPVLNFIKLS